MASYGRALDGVEGVEGTSSPAYLGDGVWRVEADLPGAPSSAAAQRVAGALRGVAAPFPALVGGSAAELEDSQAAVGDSVGLALAMLVVLTCTALWLMTVSVVLPVKALLMNFLTLAAATGILVFVFQEGNLAGLFGSAAQGGVEQTDYLVMAAIVFGLSTDYGVFLLTRIKEARDRGANWWSPRPLRRLHERRGPGARGAGGGVESGLSGRQRHWPGARSSFPTYSAG